jgi:hypothetical protein
MHSFILKREFITNEGTLYEVLRIINEQQAPQTEHRDSWKQFLDADIVFKRGEHLYFCRTIQEAIIINDNESSTDGKI